MRTLEGRENMNQSCDKLLSCSVHMALETTCDGFWKFGKTITRQTFYTQKKFCHVFHNQTQKRKILQSHISHIVSELYDICTNSLRKGDVVNRTGYVLAFSCVAISDANMNESYQPTELSSDTCGTLCERSSNIFYIITLQGIDKHVSHAYSSRFYSDGVLSKQQFYFLLSDEHLAHRQ